LGCDPLAAAVLFGLPVALRLVPIDVTMPLFFDDDDRAAIRSAGRLGHVIDVQSERWLDAQAAARGRDRVSGLARVRLHDPVAVVGIVDPDVETGEMLSVSVYGGPGRVTTRVDALGRPATVVRSADGPRLRRTLVDTIRAAG